ncbi:fatty acid synthase-like [Battus philenor]|uniref:fatty acid synthase-like n=1 Tax=Battus philenor TaxID=42288 RepID=UPI0035D130B3
MNDETQYRRGTKEEASSGKLLTLTCPDCTDIVSHVAQERISPGEMRGARAAVIVAICFTESDRLLFHDKLENNYHGVNGCSRGAMAARISRWLGLTGPAYAADTACSSALSAVQRGYRAIADGECDAAIVAGANLCLNPMLTMQFVRLGVSSQEGRCRCFDERADGYVRSEAVVVCVLQRAKHARSLRFDKSHCDFTTEATTFRVYAKIVHAKMNCDGYKEQSITYPSGQDQRLLLNAFYKECSVDPSTVEFVEAHGTGTKIGDVEELKAIDEVFSVGRTEPVLIGSVKSNMGHSEAASGMCSLAKACIAYNSGYIPPNLHYETPRQEILGLVAGRLQVVSDKRPWGRGRYAINNFGFGGANAHVLLEKYARTKVNNGLPSDDLPRLVCVSGRTSSAVDKILNDLESKPIDVEVVRLWHAVHATRILNHSHRGYVLLGNGFSKSIPLHRHSRRSGRARRPVWFVYSGMGDQWSRVANHLKALTVFSNSITKSRDALKSKGIDLLDIVYTNKATSVGALASCFVGAVAVQIGLTDVLRSVGVEPDHIVGEGVGQLACAYADGCLTAAQAILCAYCCAVSFNEATTVKGSMAIVSKGIKKIKELCPVELEVVCHDVVSCSAVAGPAAAVQDFVNRLTAQGVAVKQINSADVALHSRYVTNTSKCRVTASPRDRQLP